MEINIATQNDIRRMVYWMLLKSRGLQIGWRMQESEKFGIKLWKKLKFWGGVNTPKQQENVNMFANGNNFHGMHRFSGINLLNFRPRAPKTIGLCYMPSKEMSVDENPNN